MRSSRERDIERLRPAPLPRGCGPASSGRLAGDWATFVQIAPKKPTWDWHNTDTWRMIPMSKSNSHADEPTIIADTNLSRAWARLFLQIFDSRRTELLSPLTLSLTGFDADGGVAETAVGRPRSPLDRTPSSSSARFPSKPSSLHRSFLTGCGRSPEAIASRLFSLYAGAFPRYVAMDRAANGRGLYFERMTNFSRAVPCDGNQLEFILSRYNERAGVRDTMLQVAIFDPARDHIKTARARLSMPAASFLHSHQGGPGRQRLLCNAVCVRQGLRQLPRSRPARRVHGP